MHDAPRDQAAGLRDLFGVRRHQVCAVAAPIERDSAAVSVNLACALTNRGHRVLVLDRARGEVAGALGLKPRYDLAQAIDGHRRMKDVLLISKQGIGVVSAAKGLDRLAADGTWPSNLQGILENARASFDVWLINGLPPANMTWRADGKDASTLLVIAPTAAAITAAYAHMKKLARERQQRAFRVIVDRAPSESAALNVYRSIAFTARRFLSAQLDYCGHIPNDDSTRRSPSTVTIKVAASQSPSGRAFARLAEAIAGAAPSAAIV